MPTLTEQTLPTLISCVKITKYNSPQNKTSYGRRTAGYFELELILDGNNCGGEIYVDGEWIKTVKNRLFIRSKGMELEGVTPYSSYFLVFDFANQELFNNLPNYIDVENEFYIKGLFDTIYAEQSIQSPEQQYLLQGSLCLLIAYVMRQNELNRRKKQSGIHKVIKHINLNLDQELISSDLAKMAMLSQNQFAKRFKEITGENPISYINAIRISKGCDMLVSTNYSIEDISQKCGYPSASYFYRRFKQKIGESPADYRKKMRIYNTNL